MCVNTRQKYVYLPAVLSAGSFFTVLLLGLLTSPVDNISYSIIFFAGLLLFFLSTAYLILFLQNGSVRAKACYRLVVIGLILITALMLRSTQSLGWGDILVLMIISILMLFYTGRRSY